MCSSHHCVQPGGLTAWRCLMASSHISPACRRLPLQVEELQAEQAEQVQLAEAVQQLGAEKAGLEERLAQAEADGASLRRMVRVLKCGDSAAPSPVPGSLAGGGEGSAARPGARIRLAAWQQEGEEPVERQLQQGDGSGSNSGSSDEAEEEEERQQAQPGRGSVKRGVGSSRGGSHSHRFLEEQVQSLTAALRRLQRQNRELLAQLEAAGPAAAAGALVPAADGQLALQQAPPAELSALQLEVSSLAGENAALRRQLAEAEEEAGRAQWAMHQQQAEARALHSQVVEVGGRPRDGGAGSLYVAQTVARNSQSLQPAA